MPAFVSPNGDYVEIMDLWCISKPKRNYDPRGGDGTYLKVSAGGRTMMYVTGPRATHCVCGEVFRSSEQLAVHAKGKKGHGTRTSKIAWAEVNEYTDISLLVPTDKTGQLQHIPSGKIKKRSRRIPHIPAVPRQTILPER